VDNQSGIRNPDDAKVIAERARSLGLSTTVGVIHDTRGELGTLNETERSILDALVALGGSTFDVATYNRFQKNLANGRPNEWHCGAGSRYLYICEDGLVHWCSQQRGHPGIPLEQYGAEDLRRQYHELKSCAPFCTVSCVHRVALLDRIRTQPIAALDEITPASASGAQSVRALRWMFVTGPYHDRFRAVAARLLGSK